MTWTFYADTFESGELSDTSKSQSIKFDKSLVLRAVRTWIVFYGNPSFTDLRMKIYSNDALDDTPQRVIATSLNRLNLSDIKNTEAYGHKSVYFSFDDVPVRAGDTYHLVLNAASYSPVTDTSFLAWTNVWPDPVYKDNVSITGNNFLVVPYMIEAVVGSEL